jgi:hypothetical protein
MTRPFPHTLTQTALCFGTAFKCPSNPNFDHISVKMTDLTKEMKWGLEQLPIRLEQQPTDVIVAEILCFFSISQNK